MPITCLACGGDGECLIAKDDEDLKEHESTAWDEEGKCRYKEKGRVAWQKCDYYMEDPYIKILCANKQRRK